MALFFSVDALMCASAIILLTAWVRCVRYANKSENSPPPPGPRGKPLIGSALDIAVSKPWYTYTAWKEQYGDVVYTEALGNGFLILNSIEAINDLLDKKPNIYSDRPILVMACELMGLNNGTSLLPCGPTWKQHRKLMQICLSPDAVKKYHSVQDDIVAMYLHSLLDNPQDFITQLRLAAGRIIMSVTYGLPALTPDSDYITDAEETVAFIGKSMVLGAYLVDLIPLLKHLPSWLPFNSIYRTAEAGRRQIESMVNRPFNHVKQQILEGSARDSFTYDCLKRLKYAGAGMDDPDHIISWAAGTMYGAGGETTYAIVLSFILAMAIYPDVQAKIKEEIDRVVGGGRLPSMQDRQNLSYINATIKEALRWRIVLPLSIARKTNHPDFYNGYYIPEGTTVLPNVWAITQDVASGIPTDDFSPERFLEGRGHATATDPYSYAFGFGRRVCPGRYLGDNNLFLLISGLMATMNITKLKDAQGNEIPVNPAYTSGLVSYPEPFDVSIVPRTEESAALIKERFSQIY